MCICTGEKIVELVQTFFYWKSIKVIHIAYVCTCNVVTCMLMLMSIVQCACTLLTKALFFAKTCACIHGAGGRINRMIKAFQ